MDYTNSQMKLDQLIGYLNDDKINLLPSFQRGQVWPLKTRQGLLKNIVNCRPIPAIFLYKDAEGSKYSYNILDGKQRLESLILFIGGKRSDLKVNSINKYFFNKQIRDITNFAIDFEGDQKTFEELPDNVVRDFREYAIPTIEINMNDTTSLDEIIDLFIDINQQGVKVDRFDIVKAMQKNPLLADAFNMIAIRQKRGADVHYKKKNTAFSRVLENLQVVRNLESQNAKVDRMWQRLLEIVLFYRTEKHRAPAQILRSFIRLRDDDEKARISAPEMRKLQMYFTFLSKLYEKGDFDESKLATDQTHFYTMATSLVAGGLLEPTERGAPNTNKLQSSLLAFAKIIDGKKAPTALIKEVKAYMDASQSQTTHTNKREERQRLFLKIVAAL